MLILFRIWLSNEKIRQSAELPALQSSEELTADLLTKPAVVPAFTIRIRIQGTLILADLPEAGPPLIIPPPPPPRPSNNRQDSTSHIDKRRSYGLVREV